MENKDVIVINRMYTGDYLDKNLGHEVINMFATDNGEHYLYLNSRGNLVGDAVSAKSMLLVMYVENDTVEVVGMAKGLEPCKGAIGKLKKNLKDKDLKVKNDQVEYVEANKICYWKKSVLEIFNDAEQQNIYVSYKAKKFYLPKKRVFIHFTKEDSGEIRIPDSTNSVLKILRKYNFGKQSLRQYIKCDKEHETDYNTIYGLINDETLWEESNVQVNDDTLKNFKPYVKSLFDICDINNDENVFSNALKYFIEKYPELWTEFFREKLNITEYTAPKKVERELDSKVKKGVYKSKYENHTGGRIDLLLNCDKCYIIIENKIKSGINKVKTDEDDKNQLDRYTYYLDWKIKESELLRCFTEEELKELKPDDIEKELEKLELNKGYVFVLSPNYNVPELPYVINLFGREYVWTSLTYKDICDFLKDKYEVQDDDDFKAFYNAMQRHQHSSASKALYEDMKNTFFERIQKTKQHAVPKSHNHNFNSFLVTAKGICPRCGKPYSDFGMLTEQGVSFYCDRCSTEYKLCPDCRKEVGRCPKCGGRLLDSWENAEKMFGGRILF